MMVVVDSLVVVGLYRRLPEATIASSCIRNLHVRQVLVHNAFRSARKALEL